jgi:hypothetical protein
MELILSPRLFKIKVHYAVKQNISFSSPCSQNWAKGINTFMVKKEINQMEERE